MTAAFFPPEICDVSARTTQRACFGKRKTGHLGMCEHACCKGMPTDGVFVGVAAHFGIDEGVKRGGNGRGDAQDALRRAVGAHPAGEHSSVVEEH
jgi:hypothetical protein